MNKLKVLCLTLLIPVFYSASASSHLRVEPHTHEAAATFDYHGLFPLAIILAVLALFSLVAIMFSNSSEYKK